MARNVAVAVIHGMGEQKKTPGMPSNHLTFSGSLYKKVRGKLSADEVGHVAWREIFWQDIMHDRQLSYLNQLNFAFTWKFPRRFVMTRLADAASYRRAGDDGDEIYDEIHLRVRGVLEELRNEVGEDRPLILVAHSLGGHILSNYIYDNTKDVNGATRDFHKMGTLQFLMTFGCNIPVFTFAYQPEKVTPIQPPIAHRHQAGDAPWWMNIYDKNDPLGYPLGPIGPSYDGLIRSGQLVDERITSGLPLPVISQATSHNAYWKDRDVYVPLAQRIKAAIAANQAGPEGPA